MHKVPLCKKEFFPYVTKDSPNAFLLKLSFITHLWLCKLTMPFIIMILKSQRRKLNIVKYL